MLNFVSFHIVVYMQCDIFYALHGTLMYIIYVCEQFANSNTRISFIVHVYIVHVLFSNFDDTF